MLFKNTENTSENVVCIIRVVYLKAQVLVKF